MRDDRKRKKYFWMTLTLLAFLLFFMGIAIGRNVDLWYSLLFKQKKQLAYKFEYDNAPLSVQPGPERQEPLVFQLEHDDNSVIMKGKDDLELERWSDVLGNYYSGSFIRNFSYEKGGENGPEIRLKYKKKAKTLSGRIEVRNLKPNFAYQLKLLGDFNNHKSFDIIGKIGRWRLPGRDTNFTYEDYVNASDQVKAETEAYIFFDFLVTDEHGNAVRNFELDSSLHVLWTGRQNKRGIIQADTMTFLIKADNPDIYARPKRNDEKVFIWAEKEPAHYRSSRKIVRLPPGVYKAYLVLTEESFHSVDNDGGWWATVAKAPLEFEIVRYDKSVNW